MSSTESSSRLPSCDAYFEAIQSKKKLPYCLQECLTSAFAEIPVSSFPQVPGGKVIEISGESSVLDAVRILSEHNIMTAPVRNPKGDNSMEWREIYLGVIDYAAIILWVLENAELAAVALSAGSAAAVGVGAGTVGAIGATGLGSTGPATLAGLTPAAVGAAVTGGLAAEKGRTGMDASSPADNLGENFYKILQEEPLRSTTVICVKSDDLILEAFRRMKDNRIGGLPVIEGPGCKIVGSVSIRDIRFLLLKPDLFANFRQLTVMDFLKTLDSEGQVSKDHSSRAQPVVCSPNACLGSVIDSLASKSVHRVYVVEGDENEVVGVITLRDVISCFIYEPSYHFDKYFGCALKELQSR